MIGVEMFGIVIPTYAMAVMGPTMLMFLKTLD